MGEEPFAALVPVGLVPPEPVPELPCHLGRDVPRSHRPTGGPGGSPRVAAFASPPSPRASPVSLCKSSKPRRVAGLAWSWVTCRCEPRLLDEEVPALGKRRLDRARASFAALGWVPASVSATSRLFPLRRQSDAGADGPLPDWPGSADGEVSPLPWGYRFLCAKKVKIIKLWFEPDRTASARELMVL